MSKELTTEEKLTELKNAGKEIKQGLTDLEIADLYLELEIERETEGDTKPVEPVKPIEDDKPAPKEKPLKGYDEKGYAVVLGNANPQLGDKDPDVIKWCKANMSEKEFKDKYRGRKFQEAE